MIIKQIFFDTETTGLDFENDQIIELAMLTYVDGKNDGEYNLFISCPNPLPSHIKKITGITDQMLEEEGRPEKEVAQHLKEVLDEGDILMIAHNAQFDLSFIYYLLKRHFPDEVYSLLEKNDWIDTLTVVKDCKNYPHKLSDVVDYYDLKEVNFHRAIDDTKALCEIYNKLEDIRGDYLMEYKNCFGFNPKYGRDGVDFKFIKYRPQPYHNRGELPDDEILPLK